MGSLGNRWLPKEMNPEVRPKRPAQISQEKEVEVDELKRTVQMFETICVKP